MKWENKYFEAEIEDELDFGGNKVRLTMLPMQGIRHTTHWMIPDVLTWSEKEQLLRDLIDEVMQSLRQLRERI